ncbi:RagB/SusD family nutrient uptake outer membrane protein [Chitinophaga silvatica]|uniref:RagB/SusD family nutrient uptake outer membrane protein n=1 Tax=Chitinophaga silvatica TaxID=2282649 RepID=A0A3E1Y6G6_9BACT|nr:RagB/SusD family nutrient uptake outer membrane protein [Chitinophaga silvatica]RFS20525.1 RagB/SusD family nutrient uptake outer membrane protein [Chitinophaga silvatica]
MKKVSYYIPLLLSGLALVSSCQKDFLDKSPKSQIEPGKFFNTEKDLEIYTNGFYAYLPGPSVYSDDWNSDNVESSNSDLVAGRLITPSSAGDAGWTWDRLRNINFFLENYNRAVAPDSVKAKYAGMARFWRASFYFDKVKRFGDVPWYSTSLNESSPELYNPRTPRKQVMDSVIADIDYAIAHLASTKSISRITKWTALALKSRVCLYEGSYRKYHTELKLEGDATDLLKASVAAAEALFTSGYKLYSTGNPSKDYMNLFVAESANPDEVILAEVYDDGQQKRHAANGVFTVSTLAMPGYTKSFIDGFLMSDGTPFSAQPGYKTKTFLEETQNRDPRLAQIIRTPGYMRIGTTKKLVTDFTVSLTGYQGIKFVTGTNQDAYNTNTNDLPIFRYAEVLLNYAEAKAILGDLNQANADKSINLLRRRVGMPDLNVANIIPDPQLSDLYRPRPTTPGEINPVVLEVRRERRIELATEGFRYQDLMRWKMGDILADPFYGMYVPAKGELDLDGDGKADVAIVDKKPDPANSSVQYYIMNDKKLEDGTKGRLMVFPNLPKTFSEKKNYLFPLPLTDLLLNKNLVQNEGWNVP